MTREQRTVAAMLEIYCAAYHETSQGLCEDCEALREYTFSRLAQCPFGTDKPVCSKCPIHCYKAAMRQQIRDVMRFAGPKMILRRPLLAIGHLLDKRKPAPDINS